MEPVSPPPPPPPPTVELRSDTFTLPTPAMRQAMFTAECGDDVWGEDETVKLLERRAATLTNKKAALWVPTGTMGNLTALLSHCSRRGEEAIVGRQSHIYQYEAGGASVLGGIAYNVVDEEEGGGPAGTLRLAALRAAVRRPFGGGGGYGGGAAGGGGGGSEGQEDQQDQSGDPHSAPTRLVCLETTHNRCGGAVLPLAYLREVRSWCDSLGLKVHLDGARLFNAAVSLGCPVSEITKHVDTVTFCLSKGLGAPAGSVLCGDAAVIARARRWRKVCGGGLRQVGVLASPGLVALSDANIARLARDHANARRFAEGVRSIEGMVVDGGASSSSSSSSSSDAAAAAAPQTNIVVFGFSHGLAAKKNISHEDVAAALRKKGVKIAGFRDRLRAVMSYMVTEEGVDRAVEALREVMKELLV